MFEEAQAIQARLDLALNDNATAYWTDFKRVVGGEVTKEEWDRRAKNYLGELNIHIHNEFIAAVFKAADAEASFFQSVHGIASNPSSASKDSKAKPRSKNHQTIPSSNFVRDAHRVQLGPKSRDAKGKILKQQRRRKHLILSQRRGSTRTYPNHEQIRARMYIGQVESGLRDVDFRASRIIEAATESYIKTLLEEMVVVSKDVDYEVVPRTKLRHRFRRKSTSSDSTAATDLNQEEIGKGSRTSDAKKEKATLGLKELALATEQSPRIIGADVSAQRTKIMVALSTHY